MKRVFWSVFAGAALAAAPAFAQFEGQIDGDKGKEPYSVKVPAGYVKQ